MVEEEELEERIYLTCNRLKMQIQDEEKAAEEYRRLSDLMERTNRESIKIGRYGDISREQRRMLWGEIETVRKISEDEQRHKDSLEQIYKLRCG